MMLCAPYLHTCTPPTNGPCGVTQPHCHYRQLVQMELPSRNNTLQTHSLCSLVAITIGTQSTNEQANVRR